MPKKSRFSKSRGKFGSKKKGQKRKTYSNGCHYCGANIFGMPHYCKFCGKKHCDKHLLPEDHKCPDLKTGTGWDVSRTSHHKSHSHPLISRSSHRSRSFSERHHPRSRRSFRVPRIRMPRINIFFKALIVALITLALAYYYSQYTILLWIEAVA